MDLVEVDRVERLLSRYEHAAGRLFTPGELEHCGARSERLAARFAAKAGGRPRVALHGNLAALAKRSGVRTVDVSLAHTRDLAIAQVVAAS